MSKAWIGWIFLEPSYAVTVHPRLEIDPIQQLAQKGCTIGVKAKYADRIIDK